MSSSTHQARSPIHGTPPTSARPGGAKAQIPGFQAVPITKRNAVYDVPPRWEIAPDGAEDGFGDATGASVRLDDLGY